MRQRRLPAALLAGLLALPRPALAGTITTPAIVAGTAAATPACLQWMPVGLCFWLYCSWSGCRVRSSVKVGHWPLQTWGGVYPRTGWTTQAEEPKAAALNAQRAGDIVTRTAQPHVYVALSGVSYLHNDVTTILDNWVRVGRGGLVNRWVPSFSGQKVWPPGPLLEGEPRTGTWQMLVPRLEARCRVFGTNDLASAAGWGGGRVDVGGDYAWNLWRPYQCCQRRGQVFLGDVNWIAYPP